MCIQKAALLASFEEIRSACAEAASPVDINLNAVIIEIDRLAASCIGVLSARVESKHYQDRKEK